MVSLSPQTTKGSTCPFVPHTRVLITRHATLLRVAKFRHTSVNQHRHKPNLNRYEWYEKVEHGDMNWIVPDKFVAFAGPSATVVDADGFPSYTPEDYVPIFKSGGVSLVVRLNKKQYDRRRYIDHGIKHVDLYFLDGSCPPREIISKFLYIAENEPGAIAVHCKAGLGRTGTLIGLYSQKHYNWRGREWIGWNRICRPGSMLGPQQQFICDMEAEMWQAGQVHRANLLNENRVNSGNGSAANGNANPNYRVSLSKSEVANTALAQLGIMGPGSSNANNFGSRQLKEDERVEDVGQGERLTGAKRQQAMQNAERAAAMQNDAAVVKHASGLNAGGINLNNFSGVGKFSQNVANLQHGYGGMFNAPGMNRFGIQGAPPKPLGKMFGTDCSQHGLLS